MMLCVLLREDREKEKDQRESGDLESERERERERERAKEREAEREREREREREKKRRGGDEHTGRRVSVGRWCNVKIALLTPILRLNLQES